MAVKYITYKGEEYPIKIGYKTLKRLQEEAKNDKSIDLNNIQEFEVYEKVLFFGLEQGCQIEEKPMPFKRTDMEDILDEVFIDFMKMIPEFFQKADEIKKKMEGSGTTSKKSSQT